MFFQKTNTNYLFKLLMSLFITLSIICVFFPSVFVKNYNNDTVKDWKDLEVVGKFKIDGNNFKLEHFNSGLIIPLKYDCKEIKVKLLSIEQIKSKKELFNIQLYYPDKNGEFSEEKLYSKKISTEDLEVIFDYSGKAGSKVRIDLGKLKGEEFNLDKIEFSDKEFKMNFLDGLFLLFLFLLILTFICKTKNYFECFNKNKIIIYIAFILFCCLLFWVICLSNGGKFIDSVFFQDRNDSFMDYFNSLINANYDPYADRLSNYPALACLFYKFMKSATPLTVNINDAFALRNSRDTLLVFILYNFISIWSVQTMLDKKISLHGKSKKILFLSVFLSAPFLYAIERGNLILLVFAFTLFFCLFYDSKNKVIKEISFIALAIAAAMKLYPAVFGLILLKKGKMKEAVRLALYGILIFSVPFLFYQGIDSIKIMIKAISIVNNYDLGYGYNFSLYNIVNMIGEIYSTVISKSAFNIISIGIIIGSVIGIIYIKEQWKISLILSLMIILIPKTSYSYSAIFIIIPFLLFINKILAKSKYNNILSLSFYERCHAVFFAILLIPWPMGSISMLSQNFSYGVSYSMFFQYFAVLGMVLVLLLESVNSFISSEIWVKRINEISILLGTLLFVITLFMTILPS